MTSRSLPLPAFRLPALPHWRPLIRFGLVAAAAMALSACSSTLERLSRVGEAPTMSPISNPVASPSWQPVSMPMPAPTIAQPAPNSLWRPGSRAFFKDQRAKKVGDILTVKIDINNDNAQLSDSTSRKRTGSEVSNLTSLFGLETTAGFTKVLPNGTKLPGILNVDSTSQSGGTGTVARSETIQANVAAVITQVLPNGNLVISGRQEILVNYDLRVITISGVIRPEDIAPDNSISHDKIAEARISYGGRGELMDIQQPRWGQQIYDILFPW